MQARDVGSLGAGRFAHPCKRHVGAREEDQANAAVAEVVQGDTKTLSCVEVVLGAHRDPGVGASEEGALVDDEVEALVASVEVGAALLYVHRDAFVDGVVEARVALAREFDDQGVDLHRADAARLGLLEVEQTHARTRADHQDIAARDPLAVVEQAVAREGVGVVDLGGGPPLPEAVVEAEQHLVLEGVEVDLLVGRPARVDLGGVPGAYGRVEAWLGTAQLFEPGIDGEQSDGRRGRERDPWPIREGRPGRQGGEQQEAVDADESCAVVTRHEPKRGSPDADCDQGAYALRSRRLYAGGEVCGHESKAHEGWCHCRGEQGEPGGLERARSRSGVEPAQQAKEEACKVQGDAKPETREDARFVASPENRRQRGPHTVGGQHDGQHQTDRERQRGERVGGREFAEDGDLGHARHHADAEHDASGTREVYRGARRLHPALAGRRAR
jgi:hypothetical protein